jgi:hypothetical protein
MVRSGWVPVALAQEVVANVHPLEVGAKGTIDWFGQWQSQFTGQIGIK